jgi:streptogramin lyase
MHEPATPRLAQSTTVGTMAALVIWFVSSANQPVATMQPMRLAAAAVLFAIPALAQNSYWIANRASLDLMRVSEWGSVLERVPTPTTLRTCVRAPDGKVWVVRFSGTTVDIYNPATATFSAALLATGTASNIAFDAAGTAWITNNGTLLTNFDANGAVIQTITLPVTAAQGVTIDGFGNKWVAHRSAPASVTRVDPTGVATNFPIAGATTLLPIGIVADYRGLGQPSHLWVTGDSAAQLAELDGATGATLNLYPVPFTSVSYPPTFDRNGRIWVSSFSNANIAQIDQTNGTALTTITLPPSNTQITTDNLGRIRATSRVTFSGVGPPCEVRRLDPATGALEIPTKLQVGAFSATGTQAPLSTQWQYSLVVNPVGDLDGDGEPNFTEVTNGTSPTDPDSNGGFAVESFGSTQNGATPTFQVTAPATQLWVVAFSLGRVPATPVPGFGGALKIDPIQQVFSVAGLGNSSLPIAIPSNTGLIGFEFFGQGITFNGVGFDFRNLTGLLVW